MAKRRIMVSVACLLMLSSKAQLQENFTDGDFTASPAWTGSINDWMVNSTGQLQSNNMVANSSFYLSTPNTLAVQAEWDFVVRLTFNPSGANYVDVYLVCSTSNLLSPTVTGYFVRIGNTQDEISLYRKDVTGTIKLVDGMDGILNTSDNLVHIHVIRNAAFQFILQRDAGNSGNFITEGSQIDSTYQLSQFFGIAVRQSTSGFFQKHFFDDLIIQPYQPDITPPYILSSTAVSPTQLDILFSEPVDLVSASLINNYSVSHGIGHPSATLRDAGNHAFMHLSFNNSFINGVQQTLTVQNISDEWGNILSSDSTTFSFYTAKRYDIVIDEVMADPSPPVGLPESEYLELKNTCTHAINLSAWKLRVNNSIVILSESWLQPDSFLILTSVSNVTAFQPFGRVMGIASFPSLDNDGARISLLSKYGAEIHVVEYSSSWYDNSIKKEGGWSLEMMDVHHPCAGRSNWKASVHTSGGTPGRKNSIDGILSDQEPPRLLRTFCSDSLTIVAYFNEVPDSASTMDSSNYKLEPYNGSIIPAYISSSTEVVLHLGVPLQKGMVYTLTVSKLKDCSGNEIGSFNKEKAGITEIPGRFDIVINEILFHPRSGEFDFVECYNRSSKIIDAEKLFISNRNASGILSPKKMTDVHFAFFPGEYIVLTEDAASLERGYFVKNPELIYMVSSMPSFPNDKGVVVILNAQGDVLDELSYDEKWHFPLVSNPEGISLERISVNDTSSGKNNWHSASSTSGFGTPTYKNSQSSDQVSVAGTFELTPKVFSPDNDGRDDFAQLRYQLNEPGYVANIIIFDARGNRVRYFQKNALLGRSGLFTWDGLDENKNKLAAGFYVFFIELFNLQGKKMSLKYAVVLAR